MQLDLWRIMLLLEPSRAKEWEIEMERDMGEEEGEKATVKKVEVEIDGRRGRVEVAGSSSDDGWESGSETDNDGTEWEGSSPDSEVSNAGRLESFQLDSTASKCCSSPLTPLRPTRLFCRARSTSPAASQGASAKPRDFPSCPPSPLLARSTAGQGALRHVDGGKSDGVD